MLATVLSVPVHDGKGPMICCFFFCIFHRCPEDGEVLTDKDISSETLGSLEHHWLNPILLHSIRKRKRQTNINLLHW